MPDNKSPGKDGITKEFYDSFCDDLNISLLLSFNKAFTLGELSTSRKQAITKLIEKKTKINDLLKTGDQFTFSVLTQNSFQKF